MYKLNRKLVTEVKVDNMFIKEAIIEKLRKEAGVLIDEDTITNISLEDHGAFIQICNPVDTCKDETLPILDTRTIHGD